MSTPFRIRGADGRPIRGDTHLPTTGALEKGVGVVVIVHGFKGFKDWGAWRPLADRFCDQGLAAIRFDLSHNGVGEDGVDFSALELFETNTYSKEVYDVESVLRALDDGALGVPEAPTRPLFLLGHSRGGADVLLTGAGTWKDRISGVVTWASIAEAYPGWADDHKDIWEMGESIKVPNLRTKQLMPIGPEFYHDLMQNRERLDVARAVRELSECGTPLCVIHGTDDPSVPLEHAHRIAAAAKEAGHPRFELHEVAGADHTFGAVHPFAGWTPPLEAAFRITAEFIKREGRNS